LTGCQRKRAPCPAAIQRRAAIYHQIEKLLQDDQPYVWLFAINDLYAAHTNVIGFDPYPNMPWWNIHTWQVQRP
jgi:ABC-type transport system substrate-binding protein